MEVITMLTLEDVHKILLDEMTHWRMHFKVTLDKWLTMASCKEIENEVGGETFANIDDSGGAEFDYCGICNLISNAMKYGKDEKVIFYWEYTPSGDEYTLTNIDAPDTLKWARDFTIQENRESEDADKCPAKKKKNLPPEHRNAFAIKSDRKLFIDRDMCARYMAFVPNTDNDKRMLEDWIINACLPIIKRDCKNADIREVQWQPFTDVDKFICKAEAMGILLDDHRFPAESKIAIEYLYDANGLLIHSPKLLTKEGKELDDLDLYSEPIEWLPKDKWKNIDIREKHVSASDMVEGFWILKDKNLEGTPYSQWLMLAAGVKMQTEIGGADLLVNWKEDEAPMAWSKAFGKMVSDCKWGDTFAVKYSLEDLLEGKCAYSSYQLNVYSCEPDNK